MTKEKIKKNVKPVEKSPVNTQPIEKIETPQETVIETPQETVIETPQETVIETPQETVENTSDIIPEIKPEIKPEVENPGQSFNDLIMFIEHTSNVEKLLMLSNHPDWRVRYYVIKNKHCPYARIKEMSQHDNHFDVIQLAKDIEYRRKFHNQN